MLSGRRQAFISLMNPPSTLSPRGGKDAGSVRRHGNIFKGCLFCMCVLLVDVTSKECTKSKSSSISIAKSPRPQTPLQKRKILDAPSFPPGEHRADEFTAVVDKRNAARNISLAPRGGRATTDWGCKICGKKFQNRKMVAAHRFNGDCNQTGRAANRIQIIRGSSVDLTLPVSIQRNETNSARNGSTQYPCSICNHTFSTKSNLRRHRTVHFPERLFMCPKKNCTAGFARAQTARDHFFYVHSPNVTGLENEAEVPHNIRLFKCLKDGCNRLFSQKSHMMAHYIFHTGTRPFKCPVCRRLFSSSALLASHQRQHDGTRPFKCETCQASFRHKSVLEAHERKLHGRAPQYCSICHKAFFYSSNLIKHRRVHNRDKIPLVECSHCKYRCLSNSDLRRHVRTHTGEKPYKCRYCGQRFTDRSNCKKHEDSHADVLPYKCVYCGMTFSQRISMENHQRTHTGAKPFQCSECPAEFSQLGNLRTHMRIHTGECRFACSYPGCGERFRYRTRRDVHVTREHKIAWSSFICIECDKICVSREDLQAHMDIHNISHSPPFTCPRCPSERTFSSRRAVISHFRVHVVDPLAPNSNIASASVSPSERKDDKLTNEKQMKSSEVVVTNSVISNANPVAVPTEVISISSIGEVSAV